jgi:hypothetical protein
MVRVLPTVGDPVKVGTVMLLGAVALAATTTGVLAALPVPEALSP